MNELKENGFLGRLIITSIISILPMIVGVATWNMLPDRMVSHFDFAGNPNQYMAKWMNVFILPLVLLATHLGCSLTTFFDKKSQIPKKALNLFMWIVPITSIFVTAMIFGYTFGYKMKVAFWSQIFLAAVFLLIGNFLPKVRQNHIAGTRVKWTYKSKKNWDHTQRFTGYAMCVCGVLFLVSALTDFSSRVEAGFFGWIIIAVIMMFVLSTILYSYIYYKRHRDDKDYYC